MFSLHLLDTKKVIAVLELLLAGDVAGALTTASTDSAELHDMLGSLKFQMPTAAVVEFTPPLAKSETRSIVPGDPGTIFTMQAGADGLFSVEISGSPMVKFAAGDRGSFDPARQSGGAGSGTPVAVKAGEWCTWEYDAENGGQTMRPQLLG